MRQCVQALAWKCTEQLARAGDAAKLAIALSKVKKLSLSFVGLPRIENLNALYGLVELRLDNNKFTKIEGLSHLVNLTWLDLSFNCIEKIEGLETLTKITDLSLHGNNITEFGSGLDNLKQLQVERGKVDTVY